MLVGHRKDAVRSIRMPFNRTLNGTGGMGIFLCVYAVDVVAFPRLQWLTCKVSLSKFALAVGEEEAWQGELRKLIFERARRESDIIFE